MYLGYLTLIQLSEEEARKQQAKAGEMTEEEKAEVNRMNAENGHEPVDFDEEVVPEINLLMNIEEFHNGDILEAMQRVYEREPNLYEWLNVCSKEEGEEMCALLQQDALNLIWKDATGFDASLSVAGLLTQRTASA